MAKPPRYAKRKKLTLQGEEAEIADAHVFAGRQRRSLSAIFFDHVLPQIRVDKAAHPEAYGVPNSEPGFYALNASAAPKLSPVSNG